MYVHDRIHRTRNPETVSGLLAPLCQGPGSRGASRSTTRSVPPPPPATWKVPSKLVVRGRGDVGVRTAESPQGAGDLGPGRRAGTHLVGKGGRERGARGTARRGQVTGRGWASAAGWGMLDTPTTHAFGTPAASPGSCASGDG